MPQLVRTGSYGSQPQLPSTPNDELQALQMDVLAAQAYKDRQLAEQAHVQTKHMRLEYVLKAVEAATKMGLECPQPALQMAAQHAIDAALLPPNLPDDGYITAGDYLRMRGHSEAQIPSLQNTFGLMLRNAYQQVHGQTPPRHFHTQFGSVIGTPYCYHQQSHRELLNGTYQLLTVTANYRKQVPNELLALNSLA